MPTQICSSGTLAACSGENWLFAYTADDERILEYRIGGGAFRTSLRDLSGKILREYRVEAASNWSSFEDFIYRDSTLLASVHPTEGTRWFGPDHLGTPRAVFNSAGSVIGLHTYYPFGEEATASTQDTQQMKFTGHERDLLSTPTGVADDTDYMHARQFSILTGRFHSFDPVGGNPRQPQSFNRYAYVLGNPLTYTDPFGLQMFSEIITVRAPKPPDVPERPPFTPGGTGYAAWLWLLFNGGPRPGSGDGGAGGWGDEPPSPAGPGADTSPCSVGAMPPGVNIDSNMSLAAQHANDMPWLYSQVRTGGAWDLKALPGDWEDAGNEHFGAVSYSAGVPPIAAHGGAGVYQVISGTSRVSWVFPLGVGSAAYQLPFTSFPFGDDPNDQVHIGIGIGYAKCSGR